MKIWKKYQKYLLNGEWHVHTTYTDGENTVLEICEKASSLNIPLIAFTEHVRKKLTYDFQKFLRDIELAKEKFPNLIVLSGVEAKVLPSGELDVDSNILEQVDYAIFAFHSFPKNKSLYFETLIKVIRNKHVNAWAHPGLFLLRKNIFLSENELSLLFRMMSKYDVLLEINKKYELPKKSWIELAKQKGVKLVRGSDIHSIYELSY